ncbi:hypothetical protein A1Q1_07526 [Trichosporon asahii var. asahii CBS 2479]|uniref:L-2-hydroxyglutarate dehydrogenase, mitochondrial n=1 Tax=Trichosporon asahii var. asahii (strain ATCC 90039 / CBS 2479 / JCM 2466 / KCTC 7840 / NBRC 103889/ NCYC 2677 / UAMH 7654) TaxID=1186058 RepID=J5R8F4_TRIAS|nr:hypothetical protein A1Q1_07526 [Trichosporon asahii var. asahii CBS 2479]EJT51248.1 hypothetical protein A1Q1_07526 [Trichosporon asahii var. asahii CBS 2479]
MSNFARLIRQKYPYRAPSASVDHLVVGGGVVGLAVAAGLVNTAGAGRTTFLVERRQLEDWQVATDKHQIPYLDGLQAHSNNSAFLNGQPESAMVNNSVIPAYFLSGHEARDMEPDLSPNVCAALLVTETGIVNSGSLVESLEREIQEEDYLKASGADKNGVGLAGRSFDRGEGVIVPGTRVVRIDPAEDGKGWVVQLESNWEDGPGDIDAVRASVVVDAAGNYMSYKGPGVENVNKLIYPCPSVSLDSLGTHLTFDLDGNIRFGPDVEALGSAEDSAADPDFWQKHLAPSAAHLESIGQAAQAMLPGVDPSLLQPDYAGFRPNIAPPGAGFFDFVVRHSPQRRGLIEMFGFASPGLTSSLAAGEYVAKMVRAQVWGGRDAERLAEGWEQ